MATTINPSNQTITQYNIQTGGASNLLNNVAPSSTSGVPVISQGASSQPVFGTAVVAGGGTGQVTLTNHGVLIGQGTSAIAQTAAGTAGQVLQSGGASADPVYSTATYPATAGTSGNVLTSNGTNFVSQAPAAPTGYQISVFLGGAGQTVVDNTTYFFQTPWTAANCISWINTEATGRFFIPKNGTITSAYVAYYNKVSNGTAETSTVSIRLNDTSDTTISASVVNNATSAVFSNTGLSISVSQGDFITVKWVAPAWATNPVGMVSQINIFVS
jgi:hypothetical protein